MMIFKSGPFLNSPAFGMIRYFVVHLGTMIHRGTMCNSVAA